MLTETSRSKYAKVCPLPLLDISLTEGFWKDVTELIGSQTVPHLQTMFEDKDISHVLENFRICVGEAEGDHDGTVFGDGDFYKWMEAAIYTAERNNDEALKAQLRAYVDLIGRAQQKDGYLSTKQIIEGMRGNGNTRLGDINNFEIYNFGHLFTTACLYKRIMNEDSLLLIAQKAAGYLEKVYLEAKAKGEVKTAVCPSHYSGLIEMYRTTGEQWYLDLARMAIELRDSVEDGTDDNQDRTKLKDHDKMIGHAVRANYLYAGVADLFLEEGDLEYLSMMEKVWRNLIDTKIYITGGNGALYNGVSPYGNFFKDQKIHQAFGYEYQLPNITAYNETCASVGFVMWAYRMFLIHPKAEYMDYLERAMLNVNLASVSFDGKKFFYQNALRRTKSLEYELVWPLERTGYIMSYCCPPNIARMLSQVQEYHYVTSEDAIWCGLYGANKARFRLKNGADITLRQETNYPYEGDIRFTVTEVHQKGSFLLKLRIPSWATEGCVIHKGASIPLSQQDMDGYITLNMEAAVGNTVTLQLDMTPRLTIGHPMIEETSGQVAVEKGPLVYCLETPDVSLETLDQLVLNIKGDWNTISYEIEGRKVEALEGDGYFISQGANLRNTLYQTLQEYRLDPIRFRMIPYFAWDNRGFGEMRIWIPFHY